MGFFDAYPQFLGGIGGSLTRLNYRHRAIIEWNAHLFPGARVLDCGAFNGRWTLAALKAGATHVHAIEANPEYAERARTLLSAAGLPTAAYEVHTGPLADAIPAVAPGSVDVMLVLGILYHLSNPVWVFEQIRRIGPRAVIFDTGVSTPRRGATVLYTVEPVTPSVLHPTLRGIPSLEFLRVACKFIGYRVTFAPRWKTDQRAYTEGQRVTLRADRDAQS